MSNINLTNPFVFWWSNYIKQIPTNIRPRFVRATIPPPRSICPGIFCPTIPAHSFLDIVYVCAKRNTSQQPARQQAARNLFSQLYEGLVYWWSDRFVLKATHFNKHLFAIRCSDYTSALVLVFLLSCGNTNKTQRFLFLELIFHVYQRLVYWWERQT